jgi:hypothetical protein
MSVELGSAHHVTLDEGRTVGTAVVVRVETGHVLLEFPGGQPFCGAPPRRWVSRGIFGRDRAEPTRRGF